MVIRLLRLVRTERHIAQEIVRKKISRVDSQLLEKLPAGLRREHPFVPHQVGQAEKIVAGWNLGIEGERTLELPDSGAVQGGTSISDAEQEMQAAAITRPPPQLL